MMRVGYGYDSHNLTENRDLILGGVKIPYFKGLDGHSDADVLTHAICDALLGAMGKGDIGEHFPPDERKYKDISSLSLLKNVLKMLEETKYKIVNIDTLIIAEEPKMSPFKKKMKDRLNQVLNLREDSLNIKATTMEARGSIGRGEAIAAEVVALIEKEKD